jgi:hypothetical protein
VVTSCLDGWDDCDEVYSNGCEIQINDADVNNCGACNNYCPGGRTCDNGACSQCPAGQTDCGICVDTQTNATHCGACDNSCDLGETCVAGVCTTSCQIGQMNCYGACIDILNDRENCGTCNRVCSHEDDRCINGKCVHCELNPETAGCIFWVDGVPVNGTPVGNPYGLFACEYYDTYPDGSVFGTWCAYD